MKDISFPTFNTFHENHTAAAESKVQKFREINVLAKLELYSVAWFHEKI